VEVGHKVMEQLKWSVLTDVLINVGVQPCHVMLRRLMLQTIFIEEEPTKESVGIFKKRKKDKDISLCGYAQKGYAKYSAL
jgi:hypothetical protein